MNKATWSTIRVVFKVGDNAPLTLEPDYQKGVVRINPEWFFRLSAEQQGKILQHKIECSIRGANKSMGWLKTYLP